MWYNKYSEREVNKMILAWIYSNTIEACGTVIDEYISEDGKYCKQVWNDGFEEIFEIS